jgi:hypothetical protein
MSLGASKPVPRTIFAAITLAIACAMASCSPPAPQAQQAAAPLSYEPRGFVIRAPLSPPAGYGSTSTPTATTDEAAELGWHASPRWSAIQGNGMLIDSDGSQSKHVASKPNAEHVEDKDAQENEGGGY